MSRTFRFAILSILVLACAAAAVVRYHNAAPADSAAMLGQDVYVWQRAWTPGVREGIDACRGDFSEFVVLGAEVSFASGRLRVARVSPDWQTLRRAGRPVGIALRIGPYRGPFSETDKTAEQLGTLARSLVADLRRGGIEPAELQVDFDCAESKLAGYRTWLELLRRQIAPTRLTFTALPSWLKHAQFAQLARSSDGYVLQVHSLDRPRSIDRPMSLCDPLSADRAVQAAGRVGIPFRVALPTYAYLVAFDENGKFVGLSAEGPGREWPDSSRVRVLSADPASMASLVSRWAAHRPACMTGIIWYRMPVAGDSLNWRLPTLRAAMAGRSPAPLLRPVVRRTEPRVAEIDLRNDGDADAPTGASVRVQWAQASLIASDALGGFEQSAVDHGLVLRHSRFNSLDRLAPGESRTIGWVRLSEDKEVVAHVTSQ